MGVAEKTARMVAAMTTIRTVFGTALSFRHTQRARLRQRSTRRKRVLRPRRIGVLGGGPLVALGENAGMLGALTFFLRHLHEWRTILAGVSPAFRYSALQARRGRRPFQLSRGPELRRGQ